MNKKKLLIENIIFAFAMINFIIFIIHYILILNTNIYIQDYNKKTNNIMNSNIHTNENKDKNLYNFFDKENNNNKNKSVYYLYSIQLKNKGEKDIISFDDKEKYTDKNIQKIINYNEFKIRIFRKKYNSNWCFKWYRPKCSYLFLKLWSKCNPSRKR